MTNRYIYGNVVFENPLSEDDISELDRITNCEFDVGDTEIEFSGDWFNIYDLIDWLEDLPERFEDEDLPENKVISGEVTDYGDEVVKFVYDPKNEEWNAYERYFLCDYNDDVLIDELKSRGYIVTKGDQNEEAN